MDTIKIVTDNDWGYKVINLKDMKDGDVLYEEPQAPKQEEPQAPKTTKGGK